MKLKNQVKNQNNLRFFIVAVRLSNWLYIENCSKFERCYICQVIAIGIYKGMLSFSVTFFACKHMILLLFHLRKIYPVCVSTQFVQIFSELAQNNEQGFLIFATIET
nr:MAG TPA: hypothetical protein [Caudoviricetes sp.]